MKADARLALVNQFQYADEASAFGDYFDYGGIPPEIEAGDQTRRFMELGDNHIVDIRRVPTLEAIDGGEFGHGREPQEHFTWSVHERGQRNHELVANGSADTIDRAEAGIGELALGELQPRRPLRDHLIAIARAHDRDQHENLIQLEEHELPEFDKQPKQRQPRGIFKSEQMQDPEAARERGDTQAPHKPRGIYKSAEMKARDDDPGSDERDKSREPRGVYKPGDRGKTRDSAEREPQQISLGLETMQERSGVER
jgi:hypothetical protein